MKVSFLVVFMLFSVSTGCSSDFLREDSCMICRELQCRCRRLGCGEDGRMSLKKLILHFLQRNGDDKDECKPLVRLLKDILKRASCQNINEERSISDLILTRLHVLDGKCWCVQEPHEALMEKFLKLLMEKCLECDCGEMPCECMWSKRSCDREDGIYWFTTTDDKLRAERSKRECCRRPTIRPDCGTTKRRVQGVCRNAKAGGEFDDNYKCRRFIGDETDQNCNEFSICTDCDDCDVTVLKGKDDIWLRCNGCKVIDSPYVQFTKGGCPVKAVPMSEKRTVKVKARYLQLNDFRPEERAVIRFPALSKNVCRRRG